MAIYVQGVQVRQSMFSGGECHVCVDGIELSSHVEITAYLHHSDAIMQLLLTVDAVRRAADEVTITLTLPYFPYARQDRVCNQGEALSVKVMAQLINGLQCERVRVYDPHSDVVPALLERCSVVSAADIVMGSVLRDMIQTQHLDLVSPDAGAEKKTRILAKKLAAHGVHTQVVCCSKVRDTYTGDIVATHVHADVQGKNLLLVDDICDGGRTFIELAKQLQQQGAYALYLYVTHGIFSQGLDELTRYFTHIYCLHTMRPNAPLLHPQLTVLGTTLLSI